MATERPPRPAARILLVDRAGRVLLFRFDPPDRAPFWVTPGGAFDPGETAAEAARRELWEETGLSADPGAQIAHCSFDMLSLEGVEVRAEEHWFRVDVDACEVDASGHTELERRIMTRWRWFDRAEVAGWPETIYPADLIPLLESTE